VGPLRNLSALQSQNRDVSAKKALQHYNNIGVFCTEETGKGRRTLRCGSSSSSRAPARGSNRKYCHMTPSTFLPPTGIMSLFSPWPIRSFIYQTPPLVCIRRSFYTSRSSLKTATPPTPKPSPPPTTVGQKDEPGLPLLNRPLGVLERPTTVVKTRTEKMRELMDQDVRIAQRKHLCVLTCIPLDE
jgi:hypothetical protein